MRSPTDKQQAEQPASASTSPPIISLDCVSHSYPDSDVAHTVLTDASFSNMPRIIMCVISIYRDEIYRIKLFRGSEHRVYSHLAVALLKKAKDYLELVVHIDFSLCLEIEDVTKFVKRFTLSRTKGHSS